MVMTDIGPNGFIGFSDVPTTEFSDPLDEFMAFKGEADSVWIVDRMQRIPAAEQYTVQSLMDALRKKFGKESYQFGEVMAWVFDASGKQVFGVPLHESPCQLQGGYVMADRAMVYQGYTRSTIKGPPVNFSTACGSFYFAQWLPTEHGMVSTLRTVMQDTGKMVRIIQGREGAQKAAEGHRLEQQKAKGVKPSL